MLFLTWGVNGVCPEEMVELSELVDLPVVQLTSADYTKASTLMSHSLPGIGHFAKKTKKKKKERKTLPK